jgi:hypothetical protein
MPVRMFFSIYLLDPNFHTESSEVTLIHSLLREVLYTKAQNQESLNPTFLR